VCVCLSVWCVCVRVCACVYVCTYIHFIYTHTHTCVCVYIYIARVCARACMMYVKNNMKYILQYIKIYIILQKNFVFINVYTFYFFFSFLKYQVINMWTQYMNEVIMKKIVDMRYLNDLLHRYLRVKQIVYIYIIKKF